MRYRHFLWSGWITIACASCERDQRSTGRESSLPSDTVPQNVSDPTSAALNGTWRTVYVEIDGKRESPVAAADSSQLVVQDSTMSLLVGGKEIAAGVIQVNTEASPHTIDWRATRGEDKGKKSLAIWEIRGDTLRANWTLFAVKRDRPTSFTTQKGSGLLLAEYIRAE
jgi:uncharacterized protein (TIGR03067 family)